MKTNIFCQLLCQIITEQPSSSSISTTTSSVTSMTSLEHESNDTSASASDYGADNWDHENWGEMDVSDEPLLRFLTYFNTIFLYFRPLKTLVVL